MGEDKKEPTDVKAFATFQRIGSWNNEDAGIAFARTLAVSESR